MSRKQTSRQQNTVVVGWTETWTNTPEEGLVREVAPINRPRLVMRRKGDRYRLEKRKPLTKRGTELMLSLVLRGAA